MTTTFFSRLTDLIITMITMFPWLVIAGVAMFAYLKRRASKLILVPAIGAGAMFVLPVVQWVIVFAMDGIGLNYDVRHAETIIYRFLLFVALCVFAAGFCLLVLKKREGQGFPL